MFPDAGRTQPFASGATCSWPALDLQVENRTGAAYRLGLSLTDTHLTGQWRAELPQPLRYAAVSYTHLDVYKRQPMMCPASSNARGLVSSRSGRRSTACSPPAMSSASVVARRGVSHHRLSLIHI